MHTPYRGAAQKLEADLWEIIRLASMQKFQKRTQRASLRYQEVVWHNKPVFISGLSPTQTQSELGFQVYSAQWLNSKAGAPGLPTVNKYSHWHHSAGENRGSGIYGLRAGLNAKRSGQLKGWPDWVCCHRKIVLELKLPKGAISDSQKEILAYFLAIGWFVEVVRSFSRLEEIVELV